MWSRVSDSQRRLLDSWKQIAAHLRRTVRTVQRWERQQGLPVRRHLHAHGASILAYTDELDSWLACSATEPITQVTGRSRHTPRLAVLPFRTLRGSKNSLLADTVVDGLIGQLCRDARLAVISRTSTEEFRGGQWSTSRVMRRLQVGFLLEGSTRYAVNDVVIKARLIKTRDAIVEDTFEVVEPITLLSHATQTLAARVADRVCGKTRPATMPQHAAVNTNAYEQCVRARLLLEQASPTAFLAARVCLKSALEHSPTLAEAHATLALWSVQATLNDTTATSEGLQQALESAQRALTLSPLLPDAHVALGHVHFLLHDSDRADIHFERPSNSARVTRLGTLVMLVFSRVADVSIQLSRMPERHKT